jgi:alanine dehydrogenase
MLIGVPKEIKVAESRVGLTPDAVAVLVNSGHKVFVETHAGAAIGYKDADYRARGAEVLNSAAEVFNNSDMIIKVKEPQVEEIALLKPHHLLFTYLHLAASWKLTEGLMASGCTAIAYETVRDQEGRLPLLAPMSQVAGRMAAQVAAEHLMLHRGGSGKLLGGVPGVAPAKITILGGGVVGTEAAKVALGMGGDVTIVDASLKRLAQIDDQFMGRLKTQAIVVPVVDALVESSDVVIGAVLIPGAAAPKLVRKEQLGRMQAGSLLIDVAIDQGGCFETSRATTHADPTYSVDGVLHYCVANMPGAVARTSTEALVAATLPYVIRLANKGLEALNEDKEFARGLSIQAGQIMCPEVRMLFK